MAQTVLMHINEVKRPAVDRRQWSREGCCGGEDKAVDSGEAKQVQREHGSSVWNDSLKVHQCFTAQKHQDALHGQMTIVVLF